MKKSVIRTYFCLCIISGIIMGIIFPIFAGLFMTAKSSASELYFTVGCIFAGIMVGGISFGIGKATILKTIGKLNQCFQSISQGNFTYECSINSHDAIGDLVQSLNGMKAFLEQLIGTVADKSMVIDGIVQENSNGLSALHHRIEDINGFAAEVSEDMQRVSGISGDLHSISTEIESAVKSIADSAMEGTGVSEAVLKKATEAKRDISESIRTAEALLSETSQKLEVTIKNALIVDEINILLEAIIRISSQTNLLALNASIESNRSGSNGKGFEVIAKEIRALSEHSKENTEKIRTVIDEVVFAVKELVTDSRSLLEFISNNVNRDYHSFLNIVDEYSNDSHYINDIITDFSGTSQELFASLQTVFDRIEHIARSADNSSQKVNQIFEEVQALNDESSLLVKETDLLNESSSHMKESISKFVFTGN